MGRIKTREVKRTAQQLMEKYPGKFTVDFKHNKEAINELKIVLSYNTKNKIAGYIVRSLKTKKF